MEPTKPLSSQQQPKLPDGLTPEFLAKARERKRQNELHGEALDQEWQFIAEFGIFFGWQGVEAILNNQVTLETASVLLEGARKVHNLHVVDQAVAHRAALAAIHSKDKKAFEKALKPYLES